LVLFVQDLGCQALGCRPRSEPRSICSESEDGAPENISRNRFLSLPSILICIMSRNTAQRATQNPPASWSNLPRKGQLCVLALCRVFDFMQVASFQTVCYYQLKSFNPSLSEETLSWQTGIASSSFSGAQIFTAVLWGRIADMEWGGRKRVLLIGLWGTGLSCVGLAFSKSFLAMAFFRLLAGASNGTVGIMYRILPSRSSNHSNRF